MNAVANYGSLEERSCLLRPELPVRIPELHGRRIMVTGSAGSLGREVCRLAIQAGAMIDTADPTAIDLPAHNVLRPEWHDRVQDERPDAIIHLAAHKHAPLGEEQPHAVSELNIDGTWKAMAAAWNADAQLVTASTCKAADPVTAYGASKLIAERITTRYPGGAAMRLVNVLGSSGSVTEIWDALPEDEPLPVADCLRYFITHQEAAALLLWPLWFTRHVSGVFAPDPFQIRRLSISALAGLLHPDRHHHPIPPRCGDRKIERLIGQNERRLAIPGAAGVVKILQAWEIA